MSGSSQISFRVLARLLIKIPVWQKDIMKAIKICHTKNIHFFLLVKFNKILVKLEFGERRKLSWLKFKKRNLTLRP